MIIVTLRALRQDGTRLVLSALAVVLGVAFLAGTLILTDGMRTAATDRAGAFDRHTDVAVAAVDGSTMEPRLIDQVRAVAGVRAVTGEVVDTAGVLGADGARVPGWTVLASVPDDPALQSYDVRSGRLPAAPGELVLDTRTAREEGFRLGGPVRVGGAGATADPYTLVGTVDVTGTRRDRGVFVGLTVDDALRVAGGDGYGRIVVAAEPGIAPAALAGRIGVALGSAYQVRDRAEVRDGELRAAVRDVTQFNLVLLSFAAVSLLVAAFVIANTFTIVLAQRARRIALLRAVGGGRGQAFRSVLVESGVIGLLGSAAGVLVGAGLAAASGPVLAATDLPLTVDVTVRASTVLTCLGVGTLMTMVAAARPAWRGTRVPPVAALTDAALVEARSAGRFRLAAGAVAVVAGAAALVFAGMAGNLVLVAFGGVSAFGGIVLFGPALVPALVWLIGGPARLLVGRIASLAARNATGNPRRVAATATSMVIGIGLVSAFLVGAGSVKAGIERDVDRRIGADHVVTAVGAELPRGVVEDLRARPEVRTVHEPRTAEVAGVRVTSADPVLSARTLRVVEGDLSRLGPGAAAVHRRLATERALGVGSTVRVADRDLRVVAVVTAVSGGVDPGGAAGGPAADQTVVVSDGDFSALFPDRRGYLAQVRGAEGVPVDRVRESLREVLTAHPTVTYLDRADYRKMMTGAVDSVLAFVTALIGLAVVISLVGVANTVALSVVERVRENAVLRAVGLTRGRLRAMLAVEGALTALTGTVLGLALGTAVAAGTVSALNRLGGSFPVTVPWGQVALLTSVIVVAGLIASLVPAERAARRPVVEALSR
ncbi:ABC transporter permease [Plantactinospora sp. GCM10030261]|uniref:ABC transporter permease n=1 Tax=Plantactinospora sp. GCM10030261 TaxID=3273420 RepID=UPI003620F842